MISDCVAKYIYEQCKSSDSNQVIIVHIDVAHRPAPETCDDSVFKIASERATASEHTQFMVPPPPPPINIKPDLGFPRKRPLRSGKFRKNFMPGLYLS